MNDLDGRSACAVAAFYASLCGACSAPAWSGWAIPEPDAGASDATPRVDAFSASGGTLESLRFAIVGDTRPASEDDTGGYPTDIIDRIYSDIAAAAPSIPFVVSTGDYMFASTYGQEARPQVDLYVAARAKYGGVLFPAMGNHECTGATASNCGPNGIDGQTTNYLTFLDLLLSPIGQSDPYYSVRLQGPGPTPSWTAKLVFLAANAWGNAQATWLASTLAVATTYTFVVRHESSDVTEAPGVAPSDAILAAYPYTLLVVGHSHTYSWRSPREVIVGNGGAPLTEAVDYGFGVVSQRSDGRLDVDMIDYQSLEADTAFHAVLAPSGEHAP